jgi:hypothetical protein
MKKTDYSRQKLLKEGIVALRKEPKRKTVYLTDARCGFKPTQNKNLRNEFESLGGTVLVLEKDVAVRWYALASLSTKLSDVPATPEELLQFLRSADFDAAAGLFDKLLPNTNVDPVTEHSAVEVLVTVPESVPVTTTPEIKHFGAPTHITLTGVKVRSKSEVIVANMLTLFGLHYEYEKELHGKLPDFTIFHQGKTFYWEHLGMLSNPDYQKHWEEKKRWYEQNGLADDLITSEDSPSQGIDSKEIEKTIRERILKTEHVHKLPVNAADEQYAREALDKTVQLLQESKLKIEPLGYIIGPRIIRLKLKPLSGTSVKKIVSQFNELKAVAGLPVSGITVQTGYVSIDINRDSSPTVITVDNLITNGNRPKSVCAVPLGMDVEGNTFWVDLADPDTPHILVGGTSGSGKSVLLQAILAGLHRANPSVPMEFTLIDPGKTTFAAFSLKQYRAKLLTEDDEALTKLSALVQTMHTRYALIQERQVQTIDQYNADDSVSEKLLHHFIIMDEFASFTDINRSDKEALTRKNTFLDAVKDLARLGRKAGIHLILATQRPDASVVEPQIRDNLPLKIALRVLKEASSEIILGTKGAENLLGKGDMLVSGSVPIQRLQSAMISETDYAGLNKSNSRISKL